MKRVVVLNRLRAKIQQQHGSQVAHHPTVRPVLCSHRGIIRRLTLLHGVVSAQRLVQALPAANPQVMVERTNRVSGSLVKRPRADGTRYPIS